MGADLSKIIDDNFNTFFFIKDNSYFGTNERHVSKEEVQKRANRLIHYLPWFDRNLKRMYTKYFAEKLKHLILDDRVYIHSKLNDYLKNICTNDPEFYGNLNNIDEATRFSLLKDLIYCFYCLSKNETINFKNKRNIIFTCIQDLFTAKYVDEQKDAIKKGTISLFQSIDTTTQNDSMESIKIINTIFEDNQPLADIEIILNKIQIRVKKVKTRSFRMVLTGINILNQCQTTKTSGGGGKSTVNTNKASKKSDMTTIQENLDDKNPGESTNHYDSLEQIQRDSCAPLLTGEKSNSGIQDTINPQSKPNFDNAPHDPEQYNLLSLDYVMTVEDNTNKKKDN